MASLGELFISLGFDVDDQKLKNFKNNLRDTHEEMTKLGTVAATALGTLTLLVQNSADGAVRLNNMALMFGANTQAAQTFANALHQVNSQISVSAGQSMFGQFSQLILGKIPLGQGAAGALALLGGGYQPGTGQTPQQILENLATHYDQMKGQLGVGYGVQLENLGLAGAEGVIAELAHNPQEYNRAGQYDTSQESLNKLSGYAKSVAELDEAYTHFANDMSTELAPLLERGIHTLINALNYLDNFNKSHPGAAAAEGIGGAVVGGLGGWAILKKLFGTRAAGATGSAFEQFAASWNGAGAGGAAAEAAGGIGLLGGAGILAAMASIPWAAGWGGGKIGDMIKGGGLSPNLSPGIMKRLMDESGLDPAAIGDGGKAYGIAQWHADRQANFARVMGRDIHGSSLQDQEKFVNWELLHGDPGARRAEKEMEKTNSEADKYRIFTKFFERPQGAGNIQITVNSNADAKTVALEVRREIQGIFNNANSQTNLAAY